MQSSIKRIQTVADQFVNSNSTWLVSKDIENQIKGHVRTARRFVMDDEASVKFGEIIRDAPELIIREQRFARAAYHRTFVEFNFRKFWEVVNDRPADITADDRLAYFIDYDSAYSITENGLLMPFVYSLHEPWELPDQLAFCNDVYTSRTGLDQFFWGRTYNTLDEDERRSLRAYHSVRALPLTKKISENVNSRKEVLATLVAECYADLRNIIGLLLLINRPSIASYVKDVPHVRGFIKGKLLPYMSHTVVSIHIDPVPILKKIGTSSGDSVEKRCHEVRGSWCHDEAFRNGTLADCVHNFIPHPRYVSDSTAYHFNENDEVQRDNWLCNKCAGHRWWRNEHVRGSAAIGFVDKNYKAIV